MRTLKTLRDGCIDGGKLVEYEMIEDTDDHVGNTTLEVAKYDGMLESGFYLITGEIAFEFKTDQAYFPLSNVHEKFALNYTDQDSTTQEIVLDVTNSFVSTTSTSSNYTAGKYYINKPIYINDNVGEFNLVMGASEFDGVSEPTDFTGSDTSDFSSTFKSMEWSDDFTWNDTLLTNTNTSSGDVIESSLTAITLDTFEIDSDKDGSIFNAQVQFQCFTESGYSEAGVSAGPVIVNSALGACHLILLKDGVEINRSSIASSEGGAIVGVYKAPLSISSRLDAGSYTLQASGCGVYSGGAVSHIGNDRGIINVLVSRTKDGTRNTYNTEDSALSYVTLAEPVFQEIEIEGTTAQTGTYLYQSISSGVGHLPNFKFLGDNSSIQLRRIF
jgi:hypothetical protein